MESEHFQAPFGVILFGSIQSENNQIEKPSTKVLTAWLLSKTHFIRQLKYRLKMIIQAEHFRESNRKHYKTVMLVQKNVATFFAHHFRGLWGSIKIHSLSSGKVAATPS